MVIHKAVQRIIRNNVILTTTLCGRSHSKSQDGFNSTDNNNGVNCKFCKKIMDNPSHWKFKMYLAR